MKRKMNEIEMARNSVMEELPKTMSGKNEKCNQTEEKKTQAEEKNQKTDEIGRAHV